MNITNEIQDQYKQLISKGYTSKQIGEAMGKSSSSVKRDLIKLGLKTIHWKAPNPIDIEKLKDGISRNLSSFKIAKELGCSQTNVVYYLKKYKLKTYPRWTILRKNAEDGYKICPKCKVKKELIKSNFYIDKRGKIHSWCKICNNTIAYQKQCARKKYAVDYKGGKCIVCGYDKYLGALDFHHVDPTKKEFNISKLDTYSLAILNVELDKCILVCKNCHAEIHGKIIKL